MALQFLQLQGLSVALPVVFLGLGVLVLGLPYHFGKQGLGALQRPEVRLAGCYVVDSFVHLFGQHHVLIQQLILFSDLLAQDVDALLEGGDGAALLRSGRLGDVLHPAVDVQAQERRQDLHAPVAVGVQEEAVGVLPDEGDAAKGVAVHTEQPLNAGLGQFHGGVALICPGVSLWIPPLEGQGAAPALGPGADDPIVLSAQGKGKGDAAALRPVADPAADVLFPGLLVEAVRDCVHEERGLTDTVLAVHHRHVYRGEVKGRLRVAPVVPDLNRPGHKGSGVFAVLAPIVGLLDDRRGQLHEAGRFLAGDVVGLQPASQALGGAVVLRELVLGVQGLHVIRDNLGHIKRAGVHQALLQLGPVKGFFLLQCAGIPDPDHAPLHVPRIEGTAGDEVGHVLLLHRHRPVYSLRGALELRGHAPVSV